MEVRSESIQLPDQLGESAMKTALLAFLCWLCISFYADAAVNINTANQAELESLPGIGPVKAKAILDYRKKHGGFKSVEELTKVDGIGPVTLKNARPGIVIDATLNTKPAVAKVQDKAALAVKKPLQNSITPTSPSNSPAKKATNQAIVVPAKPMANTAISIKPKPILPKQQAAPVKQSAPMPSKPQAKPGKKAGASQP